MNVARQTAPSVHAGRAVAGTRFLGFFGGRGREIERTDGWQWIAAYGAAITDSWPHDYYNPSTDGRTGWAAGAQETGGSYTLDWRLHAYAICATVAP